MMILKVRREYLLKELNHRLKELQKDLGDKFGFAQLEDGEAMPCAFVACGNYCKLFDGHYPCKTKEVIDLASLIVMLSASREECVEIEVRGDQQNETK